MSANWEGLRREIGGKKLTVQKKRIVLYGRKAWRNDTGKTKCGGILAEERRSGRRKRIHSFFLNLTKSSQFY